MSDKTFQTIIGALNIGAAIAGATSKGKAAENWEKTASIFSSVGNAHYDFKHGDIIAGCDNIASGIISAFGNNSYESDIESDYSNYGNQAVKGLQSQANSLKRQVRSQEDKIRNIDRQISRLESKKPWKGDYYNGSADGIDRDGHKDAVISWERQLDDLRSKRRDADDRLTELKMRLSDVENKITNMKNEQSIKSTKSSENITSAAETSAPVTDSAQQSQQPQAQQKQEVQPKQQVEQAATKPALETLGQGVYEYTADNVTRAEDIVPDNVLDKDAVTLTKDQQLALLKEAMPNLDANQLELCPSDKGPCFKSGNTYYRVVNDKDEVKIIQTQITDGKAKAQVSKLNNPKSDYSKDKKDESGNLNLTQQKALGQTNSQENQQPVQNTSLSLNGAQNTANKSAVMKNDAGIQQNQNGQKTVTVEQWGSSANANDCIGAIVQNSYDLSAMGITVGSEEYNSLLNAVMDANPQIYGTAQGGWRQEAGGQGRSNAVLYTGENIVLPDFNKPQTVVNQQIQPQIQPQTQQPQAQQLQAQQQVPQQQTQLQAQQNQQNQPQGQVQQPNQAQGQGQETQNSELSNSISKLEQEVANAKKALEDCYKNKPNAFKATNGGQTKLNHKTFDSEKQAWNDKKTQLRAEYNRLKLELKKLKDQQRMEMAKNNQETALAQQQQTQPQQQTDEFFNKEDFFNRNKST